MPAQHGRAISPIGPPCHPVSLRFSPPDLIQWNLLLCVLVDRAHRCAVPAAFPTAAFRVSV